MRKKETRCWRSSRYVFHILLVLCPQVLVEHFLSRPISSDQVPCFYGCNVWQEASYSHRSKTIFRTHITMKVVKPFGPCATVLGFNVGYVGMFVNLHISAYFHGSKNFSLQPSSLMTNPRLLDLIRGPWAPYLHAAFWCCGFQNLPKKNTKPSGIGGKNGLNLEPNMGPSGCMSVEHWCSLGIRLNG